MQKKKKKSNCWDRTNSIRNTIITIVVEWRIVDQHFHFNFDFVPTTSEKWNKALQWLDIGVNHEFNICFIKVQDWNHCLIKEFLQVSFSNGPKNQMWIFEASLKVKVKVRDWSCALVRGLWPQNGGHHQIQHQKLLNWVKFLLFTWIHGTP